MGLRKAAYRFRWFYFKAKRKITKKPFLDDLYYCGLNCITDQSEENEYIYNLLATGKPCMIGRYGSVESRAMLQYEHPGCITFKKDLALDRMCRHAGFFPREGQLLYRFSEMMQDCSAELDLLAVWYEMQDYLAKEYAPNAQIGTIGGLEPWQVTNPWSRILEGKKVVVVHPFAATIISQYENNREKLFEDPNVLPQFSLRVVKTPITVNTGENVEALGCKDWFEVLDRLFDEIMKEDFDIALIGCGAYGFPLAARVKRAGKQAVHLGGALQLLFGIKGKRWEQGMGYTLANEYWTYPFAEDTPENKDIVENGCYWK